jgi:hypothetical protein
VNLKGGIENREGGSVDFGRPHGTPVGVLDRGPGRGGAGELGMAPEGIERESMLG